MKLSNLGLGLAFVGLASSALIGGTSEAATLSFADGGLSLTGDSFQFEFLPPTKGAYKSSLFVADASKANVQTLFSETKVGDGSPITPGGVVSSLPSWAATTGSYVLGWHSVAGGNGELEKGTVYSSDVNLVQFKSVSGISGWHTFAIEDMRGDKSDYDYNDGKFRVRAVPVPAVVPGIALAAAFFGSKALKRNKKNAGEVLA